MNRQITIILLIMGSVILAPQIRGDWMAYNDCIRASNDQTAANVTDWTIYNGYTNHNAGRLKDFATGQDDNMPYVTFSMTNGLNTSTSAAGTDALQPGTDAYEIFHGIVDFNGPLVYYGSFGWKQEIQFTGLDPGRKYTFVGYARRNNLYPNRYTQVTLINAVSFVNNSSEGIYLKDGAVTKFVAGNNGPTGYVVRWDDIVVADEGDGTGSFTIRSQAAAGSDNGRAYPINGFMLQEYGGVTNLPPQVDAGEDAIINWPNDTVQLSGTATDDDPCNLHLLSVQWSLIKGPEEVSFDPCATTLAPAVKFAGPGVYELQLRAWDELGQDACDVVVMTVLAPECPPGDLNDDCRVQLDDLLEFAELWLGQPASPADIIGNQDGVNLLDYAEFAGNWLKDWTGALRVDISPPEVVAAGGQWRMPGGQWHDSGQIMDGLPAGDYMVEFKTVADWIRPNNKAIHINKQDTTTIEAAYREMPDSPLLISEFMAINSYVPRYNSLNLYTVVDGEREYPDWIEIHNVGTESIDLGGWYLTDDPHNLRKWRFPAGKNIGPDGYFVVYASKKTRQRFPDNYPYVDDSGNLHTNFELDGRGEYLALVKPDGISIAFAYGPKFPPQRGLISYGIADDGSIGFLKTVTRGKVNGGKYDGVVADTKFSVDRGFYTEPVQVAITCATPGAVIRYTTDDSTPTLTNGQTYTGPVTIDHTTALRAAAFKDGWLATNVDTHTYIFLDDVIRQATNPTTGAQLVPQGFPNSWGGATGDYQMDPDVVGQNGKDKFGGKYATTIRDDLKSIPTLSLVMNKNDWFGSNGIYINESQDGTERWCSAELIDPTGKEKGFQLNCGVRMQGGVSGGGTSLNRWKSYKLSMRLVFRGGYGPSKLRYPFYADSNPRYHNTAREFDTLVLDARLNNVWVHPSSGQQIKGQYTRDQYPCDIQLAMGGLAPHGRPVHLYLDGLYWGLYWVHERPDHRFAAAYLGGEPEDYDALKHNSSLVLNGSNKTYLEMFNIPTNNFNLLQQYLDVDDFIDYMIMNFYIGNTDWSHKNWYATRNHQDPAGRWRYHSWDAEHCLEGASDNVTGKNQSMSPTGLHQKWLANPEYKLRFADRLYKHFFNDGVLTPDNAAALYQVLIDQINRAIVGESARWGDNRRSTPYTRDVEWMNEKNRLINTYFPNRTNTVFNQLASIYPNTAPPRFFVNWSVRHGGVVSLGDMLSMSTSGGTIYYTLDGADPRLAGGAVNSDHAFAYSSEIPFTKSMLVRARTKLGTGWSVLNEALFGIDELQDDLRVTEIMYHPAEPPIGDPCAEFIELQNIGSKTINPHLVRITKGVDFTFPDISIPAGGYVVIVRDEPAFHTQYPDFAGVIAGQYSGALNNGGEKIRLKDALGQVIQEFSFKDSWYPITDGEGFSLNIIDPAGDPCSWNERQGWTAGNFRGGTPGEADNVIPDNSIVINEVMAHSEDNSPDWIELYNTTADMDINIGGWYLSDSEKNLRKYRIPDDTWLNAGEYLVFYEDVNFGQPDDPCAFALSENGETVYLSSALNNQLSGYREQEDFGPSLQGVSLGRYEKSNGKHNFVALETPTPGSVNAAPLVGPIIISEIMYNPASGNQDEEYVELLNISSDPVTLYDQTAGTGWEFTDGIVFSFPVGSEAVTVAPGGRVLVVKDKSQFQAAYGNMPPGVQVLGPYEGQLSNSGEKLELGMPGDVDEFGTRYYIRMDRVNYNDKGDWPVDADGGGASLTRINADEYGNDPINWQAAAPTPGL